jgi:hypothetical protein
MINAHPRFRNRQLQPSTVQVRIFQCDLSCSQHSRENSQEKVLPINSPQSLAVALVCTLCAEGDHLHTCESMHCRAIIPHNSQRTSQAAVEAESLEVRMSTIAILGSPGNVGAATIKVRRVLVLR